MVTLSVSSSTSGSSTATASPAFLNQRPMVASVTDSPSVGTRISVIAVILGVGLFHRHPKSAPPRPAPRVPRRLTQRFVEERFKLLQMLRHCADRGRRRH